jgi:hypothetical protein
LWRGWQRIARRAAYVQSEIVLSLVYVLLLPLALFRRVASRRQAARGWTTRPAGNETVDAARRQF